MYMDNLQVYIFNMRSMFVSLYLSIEGLYSID